MSQRERTGKRDLTYSAWHRVPTLPKFCCMADVDSVEYAWRDDGEVDLLMINELKHAGYPADEKPKALAVLRALSRPRREVIPAKLAVYWTDDDGAIDRFYVEDAHTGEAREFSPEEWAAILLRLRNKNAPP